MSICIVDTNLLVLLVVGTASDSFISSHKRTLSYTLEDFHLLVSLLSGVGRLSVTPNILTETSNLIRQFSQPRLREIIEIFKKFTEQSCEVYVESSAAVGSRYFESLGLTDAAILAIVSDGGLLLTDDLDLYVAFQSLGGRAVNFSHEHERSMRR